MNASHNPTPAKRQNSTDIENLNVALNDFGGVVLLCAADIGSVLFFDGQRCFCFYFTADSTFTCVPHQEDKDRRLC